MPINITGANGEDIRATLMIRLWLEKKFADAFFGNHALFMKLLKLNRVITGGFGTKLVVPVKYSVDASPTAEGVVDPYTAMSFAPHQGITSALWDVAEYRMPISIPDRELVLEGSLTRKLSYVDTIMELATNYFMDKLRQDLWAGEGNPGSAGAEHQLASIRTLYNKGGASTTGPASPAVHPDQLGAAVGTSPVTRVGGIERNAAGNAPFCIPVMVPSTADTMSLTTINRLITVATRGTDKPDLLILHSNQFNALLSIVQGQQRFMESRLAEMGFDSFVYRGCDVIFDDDVPSLLSNTRNAFAINTRALQLVVKSVTPIITKTEAPEQSIQAWKGAWFGQLVLKEFGRAAGARHARIAD